jgi:hypothetical protein
VLGPGLFESVYEAVLASELESKRQANTIRTGQEAWSLANRS